MYYYMYANKKPIVMSSVACPICHSAYFDIQELEKWFSTMSESYVYSYDNINQKKIVIKKKELRTLVENAKKQDSYEKGECPFKKFAFSGEGSGYKNFIDSLDKIEKEFEGGDEERIELSFC